MKHTVSSNVYGKKQNDEYVQIARAFLKAHRVFRYHLKSVADMDDREVQHVCHLWYTENHMEKEYWDFADRMLGIKEAP